MATSSIFSAVILVIIIVLVIVVYAGVRLMTVRGQIDDARVKNAALQEQYDRLTQENAELSYEIEHSDDPETIEGIARAKLGLVKPNEKIFFDQND